MDLKQLVSLVRRWFWYLVLGLVLGLGGGYLVSYYMQPIYEASAKIMIPRQVQNENPDFAGLDSLQLVQTYVQLLSATPLLDETAERVGMEIDPRKILVQQVPDTLIIEISVKDINAEKAASIANTMVQILIEQNDEMQAGQYQALEHRLSLQVEQVKGQIELFQKEYDQAYKNEYLDQLAVVDEQVKTLQSELASLQADMAKLNPTYRVADQAVMAEKQARVDQIQSMIGVYEEIRANLLTLGRPMVTSSLQISPRLQQIQDTGDLYENLFLTLVGDLEKVKLARLQQTPNVVSIEEAAIPEKPVLPIPILYTLISGIVGLALTAGIALFFEALKDDSSPVGEAAEAVSDEVIITPVLDRKKRQQIAQPVKAK